MRDMLIQLMSSPMFDSIAAVEFLQHLARRELRDDIPTSKEISDEEEVRRSKPAVTIS